MPTDCTSPSKQRQQTTAEITPVWLRLPDAVKISGIPRSTLYELLDFSGGPVRTSCLKKRGHTRGVRLVNRESLLSYIESCSIQKEDRP